MAYGNDGGLVTDQLVGLTKQVFILSYILNGLFPCQSDIVKLIRNNKKEWAFNDKFEYRMRHSVTNSGGTLNSQVFHENASMVKPGQLEYGIYRASYGMVADGIEVDMMLNLETESKQAAFSTDYAEKLNSLRMNVASIFKAIAIHGQFIPVHQIRSFDDGQVTPQLPIEYGPLGMANSAAESFTVPTDGPFTILTTVTTYQSNFGRGRYLIKTNDAKGSNAPWGTALVQELYMVLDNQPGRLTLLSVGSQVTPWKVGQYLELAYNREIGQNNQVFRNPSNWTMGGVTVNKGGPWDGTYDKFVGGASADVYTNGNGAIVGAMEGLADLFPWYTDPSSTTPSARIGLNRPFRDQPNRLAYSYQQAGGWVFQDEGEHIIDAIMRGSFLTTSVVPYEEVGIWINPITRTQMGYEEGDNVRVLRDNFVAGPLIYQRGIKSHEYQIGNRVVKEVIEDQNMPTDVIVIGPKNDMSYNCWDNNIFQIDDYIQETFAGKEPPKPEDISVPDDLVTKLDISNRIIFGTPALSDGNLATFNNGNNIRHPRNVLPIAMQELGALFTEHPYAYTVVKLRKPIFGLHAA
jgi:hypothetical protein